MTEHPSPWPQKGRFEFRLRKAVWVLARPWYEANNVQYHLTDLTWFSPVTFWFPFVTYKGPWVHWYFGWKPITLEDPAFFWRDLSFVAKLRAAGAQFVQASARWGTGSTR